MDQMDERATYSMSPQRVVFEYQANEEARSAVISGDALQLLSGGRDLVGHDQHISVYCAHWEMIHALAAALHARGEAPAYIRVRDLQG